LEIAPVFVFFSGLFFLTSLPSRAPARLVDERGVVGATLRLRGLARSVFASRAGAATCALCVLSLVAYYALRWFQTVGVERWLGLPAVPASFLPAGYGGLIGGTPAALGVTATNLLAFLPDKVTYVIVAYALVLLLPWLAPRTQIVAIPWWLFVLFAGRESFVQLGFQYGLVAAFPIFVGVAYGTQTARELWLGLRAERSTPAPTPPSGTDGPFEARGRRRRAGFSLGLAGVTIGFVVLVTTNLALTPLNPLLQNQWELGQGYDVRYSAPSSYVDAERLAALVPPGATVLASDQLFPLVADNVHAFVLIGWTPAYLYNFPFSPTNLPPYLLVAQGNLPALPAWLANALYNTSQYGVRAVAWSTPLGPSILFARGYSGPVTEIDPRVPAPVAIGASDLIPGTIGLGGGGPAPYSATLFGEPGFVGPVWSGPGIALPPGVYRAELALRAVPADVRAPPAPEQPVALIVGSAFAMAPWFRATYSYSQLASPGWVMESFPIRVAVPVFLVEVRGFQLSDLAVVEVGQVAFVPVP
jgi:hypothetical protein